MQDNTITNALVFDGGVNLQKKHGLFQTFLGFWVNRMTVSLLTIAQMAKPAPILAVELAKPLKPILNAGKPVCFKIVLSGFAHRAQRVQRINQACFDSAQAQDAFTI